MTPRLVADACCCAVPSPRTLELSPSDELVAAEHVETLRANGFDIVVDDESPPGSRVKLLSQPVSAKIVFGVRGACPRLRRGAPDAA